jgi:hypothetical protein
VSDDAARRQRLPYRRPPPRDTKRLPATLKRHGSSTALVMPMRRELTIACGAGPGRDRDGPFTQIAAVVRELDAERLCQLARGRAELLEHARVRGAHASARFPRSGSSARISTAAPTPSGSATAFSIAWTP